MKKITKLFVSLFLILCMLLYTLPAFAASSAVISASSTSVKVGDTVTVTFTVKGKNIAAAQGTFSYDSSVLTYVSGSGGASNGNIAMITDSEGGASSLSCSVKFTAAAEGKSNITVSISKTLDYSENSLGSCSAGASITVKNPTKPTKEPAPKPTDKQNDKPSPKPTVQSKPTASVNPTPSPSPTPAVSEREIPIKMGDKTLYIWQSLDTVTIPEGLSDVKVKYEGKEITAAADIENGGFPTLIYITDGNGENGSFYLYNEADGTVAPYKTIASSKKSYTLTPAAKEPDIPDGFKAKEIAIDDTKLNAWQSEQDKDFYLLYLYDASGDAGLYMYDSKNGTIQRYLKPAPTEEPQPTPSEAVDPEPESTPVTEPVDEPSGNVITRISGDKEIMIIMGGMLLVVLTLIIVLIVILTKKKKENTPEAKDNLQSAIAEVNKAAENSEYTPKHSK